METSKKISTFSKVILVIAGILLGVSIFVPIWRIELAAPQYPEGLELLIHASKLGGNVDIINGLNHYIGMKVLHTEDFIEFKILPYLISLFALLSLIVAIVGKKRYLSILFTAFLLFGIVAMVDFYRWEYNYGHNLDPHAAIIVPGMAYQPPLIGYKQLLNFGAYSVPAAGGWLFVSSGLLMLIALLKESNLKFGKLKNKTLLVLPSMLFFISCGEALPEQVNLNKDNCEYCKMTISDAKFVAELITAKGRVYKFDDLVCMQNFAKENPKTHGSRLFIANFENPRAFLKVENAVFVKGEKISSPMGGNTAAFADKETAVAQAEKLSAQVLNWDDLSK